MRRVQFLTALVFVTAILMAAAKHPAKTELELFIDSILKIKVVDEGEKKKLTGAEIKDNREIGRRAIAIVDFQTISRRSLGLAVWKKMGKKKQEEFVSTLRRLVALNAFPRSGKFLRSVEASLSDVEPVKGVARIRQTATIKGDDENPEDTEMLIDYFFERTEKRWRIVNVAFDEISLLETYGNQFAAIIKKKGLSGLLGLMSKKKKELEAEYGAIIPQ